MLQSALTRNWKATSGKERAVILEKIANVVELNSAAIARKEAINWFCNMERN